MRSKKKETKVQCPLCGTKLAITKNEKTTVATVVGESPDSVAGYQVVVGQGVANNLPKTAKDRIEALKKAGKDVSNLFAMQGALGGECIASNKNGKLSILDDNDPIFDCIIEQGTVSNRRLYRRWVMGQMFHMMSYSPSRSKEPLGFTSMIHRLGYSYQWKMLINELHAQMKMEGKDAANFSDRNRWFNAKVVAAMANDYIVLLKKRVDALKVRNCKGIPYKRISNRNIFVSDLESKLYYPLSVALQRINWAKNASQLYKAAKEFNGMRIIMPYDTPQSKAWIDAYKGSGAFFTMQNLIRFHDCVAFDDSENRLDKFQSLSFVSAKAEAYKNGQGWRLFAVLKKMLDDNNINIKKKMAEWRK